MDNIQFQVMDSGCLPLKRGRLIKTLADNTIRGVVDAIVELVTNSNDSYSIQEQQGEKPTGIIHIFIDRCKGGHCKTLRVIDAASGMDYSSLKKSIEFGGETSGFKEGKTVRGFFGRGLKESIIALGKGTIYTIKDHVLSKAEIYYDPKVKDAVYSLTVPIMNFPDDGLKELGFIGNNGTIVNIEIINDKKSYIPARSTLEEHIIRNYSLRDINSSSTRLLKLHYSESDSKNKFSSEMPIKYLFPDGRLIFEGNEKILDDIVHFKIFESSVQLDTPRNPYGEAGLLIRSEGAILDNQLFGYETDPIALYLYGDIVCPGIAKIIRDGDETIVDFGRGGLEWRHDYNKKLEETAKKILASIIQKKKEEKDKDRNTNISESVQNLFNEACRRLSDLAKDELEDAEPGPGEIDSFVIRPFFANIEPEVPRSFSIYAPKYISDNEGTEVVELLSSNPNVALLSSKLKLDYYKKDNSLLKSAFKVVGSIEGEVTTITAKLGSLVSTAEARIHEIGHIGPRKLKNKKGGLFNKIIPSHDDEPIQRFQYLEGGIIKIFVKFPGLLKYLGENLELLNTPECRALLAEILIEAFSRHISRKRAGRYITEDIDSVIVDMDRLRRKASPIIYDIIFRADLSDLV